MPVPRDGGRRAPGNHDKEEESDRGHPTPFPAGPSRAMSRAELLSLRYDSPPDAFHPHEILKTQWFQLGRSVFQHRSW